MSTTTYTVRGMTCDHCASSVREEVNAIPGVVDVQVDLSTGRVDVTTAQEALTSEVEHAVIEAGYELAPEN